MMFEEIEQGRHKTGHENSRLARSCATTAEQIGFALSLDH